MISRDDFLANEDRVSRRFRKAQRAFAERVNDAVARNITGRAMFDVLVYARISQDLEPILDEWYGRFPGDFSGRFGRLILDEARTSWLIPMRKVVADLRRRLPANVLRVIEGEAA